MRSLICLILLSSSAFAAEVRSHRGNPFTWAEHCIGSYTELMRYAPGVGVMEMDVQLSSDGVPVVIHDDTVDRTTNGTGTVVSKSLATLQALTIDDSVLPASQHIPTLEEALTFFKPYRVRVLIEPKVTGENYAIGAIVAKVGFPVDRISILLATAQGTITEYRATTLRQCQMWLVTSTTPTVAGSSGLAALRALGYDGLSWEAHTTTPTDISLMTAASLLYGVDDRAVAYATVAAKMDLGTYWSLVDGANIKVTDLDDVAWSNWATANGIGTSVSTMTQDADGDGLTNLEECAFGTTPTAIGLVPSPYGYTIRYSGTGTERRGILTALSKPGSVSWEFWWFRAEESTDGVTWTAVPSNRVTENNSAWPADRTWRLEVDLGSVSATSRVRLTPQLFPRP